LFTYSSGKKGLVVFSNYEKRVACNIFACISQQPKLILPSMAKAGPIVVVEDDPDDQEILEDIFKELGLGNKRRYFDNAPDAFVYLKTSEEQQFLIVCDINLPRQNGLQFKKQIDDDPQLRNKSIPFVFLSTSADVRTVTEAYTEMTVQGFFKKKSSVQELRQLMQLVIAYWKECRHPNSSD
jgi:CheY-like chemotaxis protein